MNDNKEKKKIFTIGYAKKSLDQFIQILKSKKIDCLVDVRSLTYSAYYKDFDENNLKVALKKNKIYYASFAEEFGARRDESNAYDKIKFFDGEEIEFVSFEKVYKLEIFKKGVNRIIDGLNKNYNIVLMCSEEQPYDCHRGIMIAEYFYKMDIDIEHIIDENNSLKHEDLDSFIEQKFIEKRKKFYKYCNKNGILFGEGELLKKTEEENAKLNELSKWNVFLGNYTREKGYLLRNYEIGYRKEKKENE